MTSPIADWLKQCPLSEAHQRLKELEMQKTKMEQEILSLRNLLHLVEGFDSRLSEVGVSRLSEDPSAASPRRRESKRVILLRYLREHPGKPFKPKEIGDALVERDEMDALKKDYHALRVALRDQHKAGRLERDDTGLYWLSPPDTDEPSASFPKNEEPATMGVQTS